MKNLRPSEKRVVKEIEEVRELVYSHSTEDPEWEHAARPHKLRIERDEMIRNFIISHHLLSQEYLDGHITRHFVRQKPRSKRYRLFRDHVVGKLTYAEKLDLALKAGIISKGCRDFLGKLNALRNKCAHAWYLRDRRIKLLYDGKNLLEVKHFRDFVDDVFTLHEVLWDF